VQRGAPVVAAATVDPPVSTLVLKIVATAKAAVIHVVNSRNDFGEKVRRGRIANLLDFL
jgi:hypothetical protein